MLSIFFAGSMDESAPERPAFAKFCAAIGEKVAEHHTILVAGAAKRNADYSIALGAVSTLQRPNRPSRRPKIVLYQTEDDDSERENNTLYQTIVAGNGDFAKIDETNDSPDYETAFLKAVKACNVVVAIGGGKNTAHIVELALMHHKPVLGFTAFPGTGQSVVGEFRRVYEIMGIWPLAKNTLTRPEMDAASLTRFLELLEAAHRKNPWGNRQLVRNVAGYAVAMLLVGIAWGFLAYEAFSKKPFLLNDLALLFLSCPLAGIAGGLFWFFRRLFGPDDINLIDAWKMSVRGFYSGLSIAVLASGLLALISEGEGLSHAVTFGPLVGVCSLFAAVAGAVGIRSVEEAEKVVHALPHGVGH